MSKWFVYKMLLIVSNMYIQSLFIKLITNGTCLKDEFEMGNGV